MGEVSDERSMAGMVYTQDQTTRDAAGAITEAGTLGLLAVQVGDCFVVPDSLDGLTTIYGVPCDEPHDAQIIDVDQTLFAEFTEMPSDLDMNALTEAYCDEKIQVVAAEGELFGSLWLYPSVLSWEAMEDRAGVCAYVWLDEDFNIAPSTATKVD